MLYVKYTSKETRQIMTNVGKGVEKLKLLHTASGNIKT